MKHDDCVTCYKEEYQRCYEFMNEVMNTESGKIYMNKVAGYFINKTISNVEFRNGGHKGIAMILIFSDGTREEVNHLELEADVFEFIEQDDVEDIREELRKMENENKQS